MRPLVVGHRANSAARLSFYLLNRVDMVEIDVTGDMVTHGPGGINLPPSQSPPEATHFRTERRGA